MSNVLGPGLATWLSSHEEELLAFRRHLHANPEPSGEENLTTKLIMERLEAAGLSPTVLTSGTGVVCDVGTGSGPAVALRGDIDALAMDDETNTPYRSQVPGMAHSCGHDVHTTVVLGVGLYLAQLNGEFGGRVRLIFQPAEERVPGGALEAIADGAMDNVDSVIGVHCDPKLDVGRVGLCSGAITSAVDMARIELTGPGGHTARPELTVNMVHVAADLATGLPDQVRSELGELGPIKLVFGSIHSGDAANVIPTRAILQASVRTPSMPTWEALPDVFERAVKTVLSPHGAGHTVEYVHGVPPVVNDAEITDTIRRAARAELGNEAVTEAKQSWGGDDFAWYIREVPGTYVRLGTHNDELQPKRLDLHVGNFDVDEAAIGVGIRLLTAGAITRLGDIA